jgi:hypothetical protein
MEVEYKQGMTKAWSDGEKVVITNPNSPQHIKDNVEQIFGMGEYDKIRETEYSYDVKLSSGNALAKHITITSGYIPQRVVDDLLDMKSNGISAKDLMSKYE